MTALGPQAGGLRLIRVTLVAIACGVILNTAGVVTTFRFNGDRVDQINAERVANTVRNCEDVNRRHDRAIVALDTILRSRSEGASDTERKRLSASRATTVLLIEALTPKRDCVQLARDQITP